MSNVTRRGLFGMFAGTALMATVSPTALMWHQSELNVARIVARLIAELDEHMESRDIWWTAEEVEAHKRLGGWPEYQA